MSPDGQGCSSYLHHQPVSPHLQTHCASRNYSGCVAPPISLVPVLQTHWTPCGRRSLTDAMAKRGRPISRRTSGPAEHTHHPPPFLGAQPGQSPLCCDPPGQISCPCSGSRLTAGGYRRPQSTCAPHPTPGNHGARCQAGPGAMGGVQVLVWPQGHQEKGAQSPRFRVGWGPALTCLAGCSGTFFFPRSHGGSSAGSGLPTSRGRPFSLGSADGQFSDSRGFLTRRRSHFSFRSCGFRAMSLCG